MISTEKVFNATSYSSTPTHNPTKSSIYPLDWVETQSLAFLLIDEDRIRLINQSMNDKNKLGQYAVIMASQYKPLCIGIKPVALFQLD